MRSLLQRTAAFLTPSTSSTSLSESSTPSCTSSPKYIFPSVEDEDPACLLDCSACTIHYPPKWSINESDALYGHIKGWATHLIIATGKTDWVRDVADEKGSVMEAIGKYGTKLENGRCMVSASNMPVPDYECEDRPDGETQGGGERETGETEVLVLPRWEIVEHVKPSRAGEFLEGYVAKLPTTESPLSARRSQSLGRGDVSLEDKEESQPGLTAPPPPPPLSSSSPSPTPSSQISAHTTAPPRTRPCPHAYIILLCSQRTRDARCGQSAPLLRRAFESHLRPLGLYRDIHDQRPGGVGIYFISHVGGHKYSANVLVYRRGGKGPGESERPALAEAGEAQDDERSKARKSEEGRGVTMKAVNGGRGHSPTRNRNREDDEPTSTTSNGEAVQCIWLARVRPEDCEAIIKYTVLRGEVVKPDSQLRGGFDRSRGLTSW